ncbi:trafficking kinesin-binding protein 2 isoform X1 [Anolis carolinensis]|uniref:trafficking kinesin-binding protein 2 isoform X1 n=1 Tax=Anolis carolinensis TaxID=28377 RepID=UPI0004626FDE|nr:PREDICTED: trafficking kinesin-binding protein 2 isoform X1 [Anolis carolinensis]|eukprot:XP_008118728.1 PREDICTED: trafficking kinesin-binding protein 2 isoform X1 [Anolis carolinensis]
MNFNQRDSESITDVSPNEDLPEVELVSMLEEQLPQYKLRVDSLYLSDNDSWIPSPSCPSHVPEIVSPVLAEETFRYMTLLELPPSCLAGSHKHAQVLSTERRDQVTNNCNDSEVVTHLLAERDRDLELAARIGQALLKRNHILTEQNEALEEQLAQAFDKVHQLQHELTKKDELLRVVSIASEESETDSSCSTPLRFNESFNLSQGLVQLDILQDKLRDLEEENLSLRTKACHLKTETMTYEEKEQQLVSDCVKEISEYQGETHAQIAQMSEELTRKNDELLNYQEEISSLLSQIVDLQHKIKEHVIEKEELKLHLQASKDAQRQLTAELHDLQERNAECLGMLHESQEEAKGLRSKASQAALLCRPQSYGAFPVDSLAAEIEGTMRKELSLEEESVSKQKVQQKRVFDTVRVANVIRGRSALCPAPLPIPGSNRSSVVMTAKPFLSGMPHLEGKVHQSQGIREPQKLGHDAIPKEGDLATALHRLTLRRQNYLSEKQFFEEEWERRINFLADQKEDPSGCSTPVESCFSLGSYSELSDFSGTSSSLRCLLPEKLQIVKPIEGSQTLFHWQQLAQPHLGTILDPRPGVVTKGFAPLSQDDVYHLSDLEEDGEKDEGITFQVQQSPQEEGKPRVPKSVAGIFLPPAKLATVPLTASNPGKCLSSTNSTFTYTNCRILHPSDITQVTPSSSYAPLCSGSPSSTTSTVASSPATSCRFSIGEFLTNRRDSTTTFSSTTSLAKLLQEQGISAKVYNSPALENAPLLQPLKILAVPSTPPNSPLHSPCPSPLPFDSRANALENFLASRPAETLLPEMYGPKASNCDAGQLKMNLVERLKKLGIARVVKHPEAGDGGKGHGARNALQRQDSAVYVNAGSNLMGGLRRNHSLPVMIGALGGPLSTSSSKMGVLKEN